MPFVVLILALIATLIAAELIFGSGQSGTAPPPPASSAATAGGGAPGFAARPGSIDPEGAVTRGGFGATGEAMGGAGE